VRGICNGRYLGWWNLEVVCSRLGWGSGVVVAAFYGLSAVVGLCFRRLLIFFSELAGIVLRSCMEVAVRGD